MLAASEPVALLGHLVLKGAGDIANGALHPLITPAHVLILLATGLLLGQQIPFWLKRPMLVLALVSAAALAFTLTGWTRELPPAWLLGVALVLAVMVAIGRLPHRHLGAVCCALAAAVVGLDSVVDPATGLVAPKALLGSWLGINGLAGYVALCASNSAGKPWARTAVRILGSWIFAIAVLVLAFELKK